MSLVATAPLQIDALTYNTRLWGQTVFVQDRPTAVYCDDHRRAALMLDRFQRLTRPEPIPDLVGFTEFWDERLLVTFLESGLWNDYQISHGPFGNGFSDIFPVMREKSPLLHYFISRNPDVIVKHFARSQLMAGADAVHSPSLRLLEPIDRHVLEPIKSSLIKMMEDRAFLGSGLVLFSRHKIVASEFFPFTSKKFGLDNYARKGVLAAVIETPAEQRFSVFLTHLHVGKSEEEKAARREQIRQVSPLIRNAAHPVLFLSDWNIVAEELAAPDRLIATDEYRWAMDQLGLYDSFRDVHPDANANEKACGYTYDDTTHFSEALGIAASPGSRRHLQRLDVILRDRRLKTLASEVLRFPMKHENYGHRDLSDHFPLRSKFQYTP